MKRAKNYFLVAAALVSAALAVVLSDVGQAAAQSVKTQLVKIINTPDEPVPTAAQGTTNVAGTVGISGTPSVNVASLPTVALAPGSSVLIDNNSMNAIPVRDVDNPARQPFQFHIAGADSQGTACANLPPVPDNDRLVIEYVSASMTVPTGEKLRLVSLSAASPSTVPHFFPAIFMGTTADGSSDRFIASQETRIYADPGTVVTICAGKFVTGSISLVASVSGYLVEVP